jgi:hypothetical protein
MMRKILLLTVIVGLVFCLTSTAAVAKNHKVKLHSEAVVSDQIIKPGSYIVKISDEGMLGIYKGKKLVAESAVTLQQIVNETPNSVSMDVNGNLKEIRFKDEKAVFPMNSSAGQTSE